MTANDILTLSIDRYGILISTEPFYLEMTWGSIVLAIVLVVGLKTLRRRKKGK